MMKKIYVCVDNENPFNSIYLQTQLLINKIQLIFNVDCKYIKLNDLRKYSFAKDSIIFLPYGSFCKELLCVTNFSNILLIYHNITPAKYFWKTEPLVGLKSFLGRLQLLFLKFFLRQVVAVSDFNKKELEDMGYKKISLCPNIIVPQKNNFQEKNKNPTILYVGRIVQNKRCIELLNIAKEVSLKMGNNLELIIVGNGKLHSPYVKQFKAQLENTSNFCQIKWLSKISDCDLRELYQRSWLYVSLSRHEGFGLPVCESINNGTPAVYTACGGQESVLDGIGLIDLKNISEEIIRLLNSVEYRSNLYNKQKLHITNYYSPKIDETIKSVFGNFIYS